MWHVILMHWTEIADRRVGDVIVLQVRGYLTLADQEKRLMQTVASLIDEGGLRFLVNLRHVWYVDSEGIGELVGVYTRLARLGGTLKLCEAAPRIRELLEATHLDTILETFDSEEEALQRMQGG